MQMLYQRRKKMNDDFKFFVDVEIYENWGDGYWAQAHYLFHGYDDVYWTNDLEKVFEFLKQQIILGDNRNDE